MSARQVGGTGSGIEDGGKEDAAETDRARDPEEGGQVTRPAGSRCPGRAAGQRGSPPVCRGGLWLGCLRLRDPEDRRARDRAEDREPLLELRCPPVPFEARDRVPRRDVRQGERVSGGFWTPRHIKHRVLHQGAPTPIGLSCGLR